MFNTPKNDNYTTRILELSRYTDPFLPHPQPHVAPSCDTNNKERYFILHLSGQEVFCIDIGSINNV